MHISDAGLSLLKASEGLRTHTYKDVVGKDTIGYGHLLTAGESFPDGITEDQATALLKADVAWAERAVSAEVKVALTQGQFDALVDFTFNLGAGTLQRSTLLTVLNAGQYAAVPSEMAKYDRAGGVVNEGLARRREAETKLWTSAS
jgi:GH24 family phage-related lysozyme (muramidase)